MAADRRLLKLQEALRRCSTPPGRVVTMVARITPAPGVGIRDLPRFFARELASSKAASPAAGSSARQKGNKHDFDDEDGQVEPDNPSDDGDQP